MAVTTLPRTRAEAKELGSKYYFTGLLCLRGHISSRMTSNWTCVVCSAEKNESVERQRYLVEYRAKNADRRREYDQQFKARNPTYQADYYKRTAVKQCAQAKVWREAHPEEVRAYLAAYRIENRDRINDQVKAWMKRNAVKQLAWHAKRNADKIRATPRWADLELIETIYQRAAEITTATGVQYDVDHIVPLRGRNVCGLHVHTNLRVITHAENVRKKNRFEGVI